MKISTIIVSILGSASIVAGSHCSTPGSPTVEITSPTDGSTTTQQGALASEATDSYSMMAYSGCAYKFSFCPEDGGSSESLSGLQSNSPWAQVSIYFSSARLHLPFLSETDSVVIF